MALLRGSNGAHAADITFEKGLYTMIKLIITDLDGTFLNSQGDFDRVLFAEINALMQQKGVHFAACTGKQCDRVKELFGEFSKDMWIVGDSATRIWRNGQYIYQSLLKNEIGRRLMNTLEAVNSQHVIIACSQEGAFIRKDLSQRLKNKIRNSYSRIFEVDDLTKLTSDFVKITVYDEQGTCPQTRTHLNDFEDEAYIVVSEAAWIDIAAQGVHKGSTIKKLQTLLNVGIHETMAFGDGLNDIELLAMAEYSFAMRNGFEQTKAAANFITGYNDDNAVQKTIKRMLSLQP